MTGSAMCALSPGSSNATYDDQNRIRASRRKLRLGWEDCQDTGIPDFIPTRMQSDWHRTQRPEMRSLQRVRQESGNGKSIQLDDVRFKKQFAARARDFAPVFTYAEQTTDAFLVGLINGKWRFSGNDITDRIVKASRPKQMSGAVDVVLVHLEQRRDAVTQHVLVLAEHQRPRQSVLHVFPGHDLIHRRLAEEVEPFLVPLRVEQPGIVGKKPANPIAQTGRHRIPPTGSIPISSA